MRILSIQSSVAYGHVGNSAAVFPLQRLGHEVWPVDTVQFSNHTGYPDWGGMVHPPADLTAIVDGIARRDAFAHCDAVLSGYLGSAETAHVVLDAVGRVKAANPHALYCCDPVLGDAGRGLFVADGIPELVRDELVPAADVLTPNHFELDLLTGRTTTTMTEVLEAVGELQARGPSYVLVTSVLPRDDALDLVAAGPDGVWAVSTPQLALNPAGAGDLTAALFLAHLVTSGSTATALAATASSVYAVLERTLQTSSSELAIVAAQDAIADPPMSFRVSQLA